MQNIEIPLPYAIWCMPNDKRRAHVLFSLLVFARA